jgi:hypothetical protein
MYSRTGIFYQELTRFNRMFPPRNIIDSPRQNRNNIPEREHFYYSIGAPAAILRASRKLNSRESLLTAKIRAFVP